MLSGPSVAPLSKNVKKIVLFLHGYGSSGQDLISLSSTWQSDLPDTLFLSPHAPERCQGAVMGYQWFALPDLGIDTLLEGMESALPAFHALIDQVLEQNHIQEDQLALVGFSQGAMMALAGGLSRPRAMAAVVAYSGGLIYPDAKEIYSKPPILLIHGDHDQMVPLKFLEVSEKELTKRGVPVTSLVCQNVGHWIDQKGLQAGGEFLRHHLKSKNYNNVP